MDNLWNIVSALIAGIIGGWAGAYFQFQKTKKADKSSFLWQFRLKMLEANEAMWKTNDYHEFMAPVNWIRAAGDDPRALIKKSYIEKFTQYLEEGWRNRIDSLEYRDQSGIDTDICKKVDKSRDELDSQIIGKMKRLI